MEKKVKKTSKTSHSPTDQLSKPDVNSVMLAINLVPSKIEDAGLEQHEAKELIKENAPNLRSLIFGEEEIVRAKEGNPSSKIIAAVGSEEKIYSIGNCGLFGAVFTAYNNHWKLRTSPDDWWFSVIKRVACAIETNAEKTSVRKMFVNHEGKKEIEVQVSDPTIYTVDYSWFFDEIAKKIEDNVRVPEFINGMTAGFSTTTPVQKIVSQITLMYSLKEYFYYSLRAGCGIPAVEMLGSEDDWKKLSSKLTVLRTLLEPIEDDLGLRSEWWNVVETVFSKLLDTYQGRPDRKWWSHIVTYENENGSGMIIQGSYIYRGWITEFLEGPMKVRFNLRISDMTKGLVSVPITLKDSTGLVTDSAALVAGMLGFTLHQSSNTDDVSVQPFQGWSLMISENSPFHRH